MSKTFLLTESIINHLVLESVKEFLKNYKGVLNEDTDVERVAPTLNLDTIMNAQQSNHFAHGRKERSWLLEPGKLGTPLMSFFCTTLNVYHMDECPHRIHTITSNGIIVVSLDKRNKYEIVTMYAVENPNTFLKYLRICGPGGIEALQPALISAERRGIRMGIQFNDEYTKYLLPEKPQPIKKEEPKPEPKAIETPKKEEPPTQETPKIAGYGRNVPEKKRPRIHRGENVNVFRQHGIRESLFESIAKSVLNELLKK